MRLWPIFLAILAWASPAAAEWRQAQSSHFIIYSKDSEEALRQFATRLERFEGAMRAIHGLPDLDPGPANRITIYAVDDADAVRRLGRMGGGLMGFYVPPAGCSVGFVARTLGESLQNKRAQAVLLTNNAT